MPITLFSFRLAFSQLYIFSFVIWIINKEERLRSLIRFTSSAAVLLPVDLGDETRGGGARGGEGECELVWPYNNLTNILLGKSKLHTTRGAGAENELSDHITTPLKGKVWKDWLPRPESLETDRQLLRDIPLIQIYLFYLLLNKNDLCNMFLSWFASLTYL